MRVLSGVIITSHLQETTTLTLDTRSIADIRTDSHHVNQAFPNCFARVPFKSSGRERHTPMQNLVQ